MTDTIPPVPILKIEDARQLSVGDVVRVDVTMKDRDTGKPYIWSRFACVTHVISRRAVEVLNLKLKPTTEKDTRIVRVGNEGIYRYAESKWPDGIVAIRMKLIHTGWIKL